MSPPVTAFAIEPDDIAHDGERPAARAPVDPPPPGAPTLDRGVATDFDTVFAEHYERLVRALTVVAGDRETAADAVQDAFVKAHLRWRRISGYDDPVGWIRRVAINRLRDEHRRSRRKRRAIERLQSHRLATSEPREIDEFGRLLAELPRQQRIATALFYVEQLTVAEIAATLAIAEGSVKSHLFDARRRLRHVLIEETRHERGEP